MSLTSRNASVRTMASVLALLLGATGCADATDGPTGPDWRRVMPDMGDGQEIDINSLVPHEGGWTSWARSPVWEPDIPKGVEVPPQSKLHVLMHADCGSDSAGVRLLESKIIAPSGEVIHAVKAGQSGDETLTSVDGISYGQATVPMICAAAAARCEGDALEWPLPTRDDPRFVPTCKAF